MLLVENLMKRYNLTDKKTVLQLCENYSAVPTKRFGQNFIINSGLCPKIVEQSGVRSDFGVLEIGTGIGTLTDQLCEAVTKVVSVEVDRRLEPIIEKTLSHHENLEVLFADAMTLDIPSLVKERFDGMPTAVVANLPYYITSPLIMKLLEQPAGFESITVMVQKEAAERLCAKVGERACGAVTIAVNYYTSAEMLFNVSAGSFYPAPKVDSAVIRLTPHDPLPYRAEDEKLFFKLVRSGFEQRRKTLVNALNATLTMDKGDIAEIVKQVTGDQNIRAERLSMEQWQELAHVFSKNVN